jgi:hypothetical protein
MATFIVDKIFKNVNNKNILEKIRRSEDFEMIPKNRRTKISFSNSEKKSKIRNLKLKYMTTFILYFCSFIFVSMNFFYSK